MERETKKIKTKSGVEVELKTYLTGREMEKLGESFWADAELKGKGEEMEVTGIKGKDIIGYMHEKIEAVVVSVGGETEGILDKILDLSTEDYKEIMIEVNKIADMGIFAEKKT